MIEIYGRATSINVRKVLWACYELRLDYHLDEQVEEARSRPSCLAHHHPNCLMPVLRDAGVVVWESNTILRYLAERYAPNPLWRDDLGARTRINQWLDWQAAELNPSWSYAFQNIVRKNAAFDDPRQLEASLRSWQANIEVLDRVLGDAGTFIVDGAFSLADIPIALSLNRRFRTFDDAERYPAAKRYFDGLADRPAFRRFCDNGVP